VTAESGRQKSVRYWGALAFQTAVHHDSELVLDSLRYIKPMQLSVHQPRHKYIVSENKRPVAFLL